MTNRGVVTGILRCPSSDHVVCEPKELDVQPGHPQKVHITIYPPSIEEIWKQCELQFLAPLDKPNNILRLPLSFRLHSPKMRVSCPSETPQTSDALSGVLVEKPFNHLEWKCLDMVVHNDGNKALKFSLRFTRKASSILQELRVYHVQQESGQPKRGGLIGVEREVGDGDMFRSNANKDTKFRIKILAGEESGMFQEEILVVPQNERLQQCYTSQMGWHVSDWMQPHHVGIVGFVDLVEHPLTLSDSASEFRKWEQFPLLSRGLIQELSERPNECIGAGLMVALIPFRLCTSMTSAALDIECLHALVNECSDIQSALQLASQHAEISDPKRAIQDGLPCSGGSIFQDSEGHSDLVSRLETDGADSLEEFHIPVSYVEESFQSVYRALSIIRSTPAEHSGVDTWEVASVWLQASCQDPLSAALFQHACHAARRYIEIETDPKMDERNLVSITNDIVLRLLPRYSNRSKAATEQLKLLQEIADISDERDLPPSAFALQILKKLSPSQSGNLIVMMMSALCNKHNEDGGVLFLELAPGDVRKRIQSVMSDNLRVVMDAAIQIAMADTAEAAVAQLKRLCEIVFNCLDPTAPKPKVQHICEIWGCGNVGDILHQINASNLKERDARTSFLKRNALLLEAVLNELMKGVPEPDNDDLKGQWTKILEVISEIMQGLEHSAAGWREVPPFVVEAACSLLGLKKDCERILKTPLNQLLVATNKHSHSE